jgi:hypothetical protein
MTRASRPLAAAALAVSILFLAAPARSAAQETTTAEQTTMLCLFSDGPLAGKVIDYTGVPYTGMPAVVGSPCADDLTGNEGVAAPVATPAIPYDADMVKAAAAAALVDPSAPRRVRPLWGPREQRMLEAGVEVRPEWPEGADPAVRDCLSPVLKRIDAPRPTPEVPDPQWTEVRFYNRCPYALHGDINISTAFDAWPVLTRLNEDCPGWVHAIDAYIDPERITGDKLNYFATYVVNFGGGIVVRLVSDGVPPPWEGPDRCAGLN